MDVMFINNIIIIVAAAAATIVLLPFLVKVQIISDKSS